MNTPITSPQRTESLLRLVHLKKKKKIAGPREPSVEMSYLSLKVPTMQYPILYFTLANEGH